MSNATEFTNSGTRRRGRTGRYVLAAALACGGALAPLALDVSPAGAWPWSGTTHVAGRAGCNQWLSSPRLVQMWAGGQYQQSGFDWLNNYGLTFTNVPSGGESMSALVTCSGGLSGTYRFWRYGTITRQVVGSQENWNIPNG